MKASYRVFWVFFFGFLGSWLWWEFSGRGLWRRIWEAPAPSAGVEPSFVALLLPRVTPDPGDFTLGREDLAKLLQGLKAEGYTPIGLEDLRGFYFKDRSLPPRAVLLALDRDDPRSVRLVDEVLGRLRMRAVVFRDRSGPPSHRHRWHRLSPHAESNLARSGLWDLGLIEHPSGPVPEGQDPQPSYLLEAPEGALRFRAAKTGYNDERQDPGALRILSIRPSTPVEETLRLVRELLPRHEPVASVFARKEVGPEWIVDWGVATAARGRLAILPTPKQTGASVFIAGTERWQDVALEFELLGAEQEFWAALRSDGHERYVRLGVTEGRWRLQKRSGAKDPGPVTLGLLRGKASFPARVKLVVKGHWALAYINGRLAFEQALRIDPDIDRGRVQLNVYDNQRKRAAALLSFVRASPIPVRVVSLPSGTPAEESLPELRELAVEARGFSYPAWRVLADGRLSPVDSPSGLLSALAGFYGCELLAGVELAGRSEQAWTGRTGERLASELVRAARQSGQDGIHLRLARDVAPTHRLLGFLRLLRGQLQASRKTLWVTPESDAGWPPLLKGLLSRAGFSEGFEILESGTARAPQKIDWPPFFAGGEGIARIPPGVEGAPGEPMGPQGDRKWEVPDDLEEAAP